MNIHSLMVEDANFVKENRIYHRRIAEGLKNNGHALNIYTLPNDFPFPSEVSRHQCKKIMESIPQKDLIIIDNDIFGVIPEILKDLYPKNPIIALVHMTLSASRELTAYQREMVLDSEKQAQEYASRFITSSAYTADLLKEAGIKDQKITTIIPGIDGFPIKTAYPETPHYLLNVAPFTRNKGHLNLLKALTALKTKNWELHCYGHQNIDPEYVTEIQMMVRRNGLVERVHLHNAISGKDLSDVYLNADLLINASSFEVFSLACIEALAHGIPVVLPTGGGLNETVPATMSKRFKPSDVYVLETILEELFENPQLYKKLYSEASLYCKQAPSWQKSIELFEQQLKEIN